MGNCIPRCGIKISRQHSGIFFLTKKANDRLLCGGCVSNQSLCGINNGNKIVFVGKHF
jgi:hypothetical protein